MNINNEKVYIKYNGKNCLFLPNNVDDINNCEYINGEVLYIENGSYHPSEWYKEVLIHKSNIYYEKDLYYEPDNESDSESNNESNNESDNESYNELYNESNNELVNLNMIHSFKYIPNYNFVKVMLYTQLFALLFIFVTFYSGGRIF